MAVGIQVTFDCADPGAQAAFWAAALDYRVQVPPEEYESWESWGASVGLTAEEVSGFAAALDPEGAGPRLFFQRVPEGKTVKNRVHLDLNVGGGRGTPVPERRARVAEAVDRLVDLGATKVRTVDENGEHWVLLQDPEGNEFCVQ
jgi:hypothetical protein